MINAFQIDHDWLSSWINDSYLVDSALSRLTNLFQSSSARLLILPRFLVEGIAIKLNRFLTSDAEFSPSFGLYSALGNTMTVDEEEWLRAEDKQRFHNLEKLSGVSADRRSSSDLRDFLSFYDAINHSKFASFFERITTIPLEKAEMSQIHRMRSGCFLRSHHDVFNNRRIAVVIYLSRHWNASYGGEFHLEEADGTTHRISPEFNSAVVFDVTANTKHLVSLISEQAHGFARLSIGGWYHNAK